MDNPKLSKLSRVLLMVGEITVILCVLIALSWVTVTSFDLWYTGRDPLNLGFGTVAFVLIWPILWYGTVHVYELLPDDWSMRIDEESTAEANFEHFTGGPPFP